MSSFSGSACLLLFLGIVFASGSPLQFISDSLIQKHKYIAEMLELGKPEIGSNPLFSSVIRSINTSCQRRDDIQLMNMTLDIYMRIFSSILQEHRHNQPRDNGESSSLLDKLSSHDRSVALQNLGELRNKMEILKRHLGHLTHDRDDVISKLNKIEVDDPEVQKKALAEFQEIYQAASVIDSHRCGRAHSSTQ